MSDGVDVRLGAQTSDLTSGLNDASASVQASLRQMQDALSSFGAKSKQNADELADRIAVLERDMPALQQRIATQGIGAPALGVLIAGVSSALVKGKMHSTSKPVAAKGYRALERGRRVNIPGFANLALVQSALYPRQRGHSAGEADFRSHGCLRHAFFRDALWISLRLLIPRPHHAAPGEQRRA